MDSVEREKRRRLSRKSESRGMGSPAASNPARLRCSVLGGDVSLSSVAAAQHAFVQAVSLIALRRLREKAK